MYICTVYILLRSFTSTCTHVHSSAELKFNQQHIHLYVCVESANTECSRSLNLGIGGGLLYVSLVQISHNTMILHKSILLQNASFLPNCTKGYSGASAEKHVLVIDLTDLLYYIYVCGMNSSKNFFVCL